ncbi:hypothetical protein ACSBR1_043654 [Camellia fascicularis]
MFYAFYLIQIPDAENWLDLQFGQTVFSCALYQMLRCGGSYIYGSCFYRWCHLQQTKYLVCSSSLSDPIFNAVFCLVFCHRFMLLFYSLCVPFKICPLCV